MQKWWTEKWWTETEPGALTPETARELLRMRDATLTALHASEGVDEEELRARLWWAAQERLLPRPWRGAGDPPPEHNYWANKLAATDYRLDAEPDSPETRSRRAAYKAILAEVEAEARAEVAAIVRDVREGRRANLWSTR
jgi:hypothetical protein